MGVQRKIFRLQMLGRFVEGVVIEEDRTEDRALGVDVLGHAPDAGIDSGHDVEVSARHRKSFPPVNAQYRDGKRVRNYFLGTLTQRVCHEANEKGIQLKVARLSCFPPECR